MFSLVQLLKETVNTLFENSIMPKVHRLNFIFVGTHTFYYFYRAILDMRKKAENTSKS